MKRLLMVVLMVLALTSFAYAQQVTEGVVRGGSLGIKSALNLDPNEFNVQDTLQLSPRAFSKEFEIMTELPLRWRFKYSFILPVKDSGHGKLDSQIVFKDFLFGPKDKNDTKHALISGDSSLSIHRFIFEFESMTFQRQRLFYPMAMIEYIGSGLTLRGVPTNAKDDKLIVEASDSYQKLFVGIGAAGHTRDRSAVLRYEIAYLIPRGVYGDITGRYFLPNTSMFVDGGYRFEKVKIRDADIRVDTAYVGLGYTF